jgi:antitoxin (DNA-binding transcriptional repressor) of toxin-antitoxin stability system
MTTITVRQATKDFAGTLRHVTAGHEAVVLKRGRQAVAVMLPPDMAEMVEDLKDIALADKAMLEHERDPSGAVTLEEYERRRGGKA